MKQSELIDPDWVVLTWVTRGIECFFLSFRVSEMNRHSGFDQFLNAMGIESTLSAPDWVVGINRMDLTLVSSQHSKNVFLNSVFEQLNEQTRQKIGEIRVNKPIEVLFEGVDLETYNKIEWS